MSLLGFELKGIVLQKYISIEKMGIQKRTFIILCWCKRVGKHNKHRYPRIPIDRLGSVEKYPSSLYKETHLLVLTTFFPVCLIKEAFNMAHT